MTTESTAPRPMSIYGSIGMAAALAVVGALLLGGTVAAWNGVANENTASLTAVFASLAQIVLAFGAVAADAAYARNVADRLGPGWLLGTQAVIGSFWGFTLVVAISLAVS